MVALDAGFCSILQVVSREDVVARPTSHSLDGLELGPPASNLPTSLPNGNLGVETVANAFLASGEQYSTNGARRYACFFAPKRPK